MDSSDPNETSSGPYGFSSSSGRSPVDGNLVLFLHKYATESPECHPLFRRYLLEVVLSPEVVGDSEKLFKNVEYYLRNYEIVQLYEPGEGFWQRIEPYEIFQFLLDQRRQPRHPRIPDRYRPSSSSSIGETTSDIDEVGTFQTGGDEEKDEDYGIVKKGEEGTSGTAPEDIDEPTYPLPRRLKPSKKGPVPGSHEDHLRLLDEIPIEKPQDKKGTLRRIPPPSEQSGADWLKDSKYRGKRQPPLGIRLKTIINFLCDDDVDRGISWKINFDDAVDYLHWLGVVDTDQQIWKASDPVQRMYEDAVDKARTHILFEQHHYDPTPLVIAKPPQLVKTSRLTSLGDASNWPLPTRASSTSNVKILAPRPIYPRPVITPGSEVNKLSTAYPSNVTESFLRKIKAHEQNWWLRRGPNTADDPYNMSLIEAQAFDEFSKDDQTGWTTTDPVTHHPVLPSGHRVVYGDHLHWCKQRGAYRAGLQQILRLYSSQTDGNTRGRLRQTPWRKLNIPNSASTIKSARQKADGPQYIPWRLDPDDFPAIVETMPYTINFKKYLDRLQALRTEKFTRITFQNDRNSHAVPVPKNAIRGGPFIWRGGIDVGDQSLEDILERCTTVFKLLQLTADRAPRKLINYIIHYAQQAIEGTYATGSFPINLRPASDEIVTSPDGVEEIALVTNEDLQWLRFLATECKNKTEILWSEEYGGNIYEKQKDTKYRLYNVFKTRVKKLLDDKNPMGLFSLAEARVTVVDLLKEINKPSEANGTDIFHYEFEPADACCWLDRMQRTGLIRFIPSPIDYGIVSRANPKFYPEHRVIWPEPEEAEDGGRERPSFLGHIASWKSVLEDPPKETAEKIWNFFLVLGFRLGFTIWYVNRKIAKSKQSLAAGTKELLSLQDLKQVLDDQFGSTLIRDKPVELVGVDDSLLDLVVHINLDDARQCLDEEDEKKKPPVVEENKPGDPQPEPGPESERPLTREEIEAKALTWIRKKIIQEVSENLTMLGPGREHSYFDPATKQERTILKYDFNWDWAIPSQPDGNLTKQKHKQYWSINRWPIDSGYLSRKSTDEVKNKILHKKQIYDPVKADLTDKLIWDIPQSTKITLDDDNIKFKPGPARYIRGDTKYQRRKLEKEITRSAIRALGLDQDTRPQTWSETLSRMLNPFHTPSQPTTQVYDDDGDDNQSISYSSTSDGLSLPSVKSEDIPKSWDLEREKYKKFGVLPVYGLPDDDDDTAAAGVVETGTTTTGSASGPGVHVQTDSGPGHPQPPAQPQPQPPQGQGQGQAQVVIGALGDPDEDSDVSMMDI